MYSPIGEEGSNRQQLRKRLLLAALAAVGVGALIVVGTSRDVGANSTKIIRDAEDGEEYVNGIDLLGRKKSNRLSDEDICEDPNYSKTTLKTANELPFIALFKDNRGQKKFEASSVVIVGDYAYAVCDSSWAITKFHISLPAFSELNKQIGDPNREHEDSGYEALFNYKGIFHVVRESVKHKKKESPVGQKGYHAIIEELSVGEDDYEIVDQCSSAFSFEGDSKGFEGAVGFEDTDGELVILALCEGNYCSESRKDEAGHGRVVAMKKNVTEDGCVWETSKIVHIPKSAYFRDYSAMSVNPSGRVAITSQEDSAVWLGQLLGLEADGRLNLEALSFDSDVGDMLSFPKSDGCETVYCNIEGITWLNEETLLGVSDKMKSKGKQDFRCLEKDQSAHVFVLP